MGRRSSTSMPEALTESFCERCGTRYEFAAPTQLNTMRKTRGLISGLKNYIMSQDALGDAVGDAMRSEEEALASQQLEAFHESFNFCINCRQYTCLNCWNDDAGRCRTCVPIAGTDDLLERFESLVPRAASGDRRGRGPGGHGPGRPQPQARPGVVAQRGPEPRADQWRRACLAGRRAGTVRAGADGGRGRARADEPEPTLADAAMAAAAIDAAKPATIRRSASSPGKRMRRSPSSRSRSPSSPRSSPSRSRSPSWPRSSPSRWSRPRSPEPSPSRWWRPRSRRSRSPSRSVAAEVAAGADPPDQRNHPAHAAAAAAAERRRRPRGRPGGRRVDRRPQGAARPAGDRRSGSGNRGGPLERPAVPLERRHRSPPRRWPCGPLPACRPPARSGRHRRERSPAP